MSADWKPSDGYVAQRMAPDGYLVEATPPAAWDEYAAREAERLWKLPGMPRSQLVATLHCALVEAMRVAQPLSAAAADVLAERRRQIEVEGWTPEHDDQHSNGSMGIAAACYALADVGSRVVNAGWLWKWTGWADWWFKPRDRRSNMVRAAALLLAEIERLDRANGGAA